MPAWNTAADWDNARAESGVIHRNFGDRVASQLAMGTDLLPQTLVDWFGQGTSQPLVQIMPRNAVYDATAGKTFVVWQGPRLKPYITYYDHTLGTWGDIVRISTVSLTDDDHGAPAICQDASGYLHVFWGTHNNAAEYAISTSARDISAWTVQTDVAGNWSYQQPVIIGGDIYLLGREEPSLGTTYEITLKKSNGVATGHTWGSLVPLASFSGRMMYPSDLLEDGTDIHFVFWNRLSVGGESRHIYYAVYETDTGLLRNAAGSTFSAPISEATGDASFRAFNSGTNESNGPTLWLDSGGAPHIAFIYDDGTTVDLMHTRWTGSAWSTAASLATGAALWGNPAPIVASDTAADLYWTVAGDTKKTSFNPSNDSGVTTTTWLTVGDWTPNGVLNYLGPTSIRNAHADLRLIVAEQNDEVWSYEHVRVGAWGASGFVQAPAYRQDAIIALPLHENSGAGTLVDYSGHDQDATNTSLVMGVSGPLGLTGAELASTREATIPHNGGQWLFSGTPCTIRFWGKDLSGAILGKGRPFDSDLRYAIRFTATPVLGITCKPGASFISANSGTLPALTGVHLYEIVWDGAGTLTFRSDGADRGTSTAITLTNFTAKAPVDALDLGDYYNSGSNATSKSYGAGVLQGLVILPRYQGTLAEHQAFWAALTAGSFTSGWKAA